MFVREKIIWENSCGKNLKAGTSSRRERFKGPSCRRGSTIAFPHRGPIGEAEARLKIRLVPPFLAFRQQHPRHRASMTLRGTTCFPSTSPRIWEPPEASPLHRGLQSIPGAPGPVAERGGGGGCHLRGHQGCWGSHGRQADAVSIFSLFFLVSVWVAHVNRKVMGKVLCKNSLSFQTPKFKPVIAVRLQGSRVPKIFWRATTAAGFTPSFSKRIFPP